jgi:hypothetical protein
MKSFDIKWISTALFIFGGTVVASRVTWMEFAFPCFVIAHCILLFDFYRTHKNRALMFSNIYFLLINTYATYNWFLG